MIRVLKWNVPVDDREHPIGGGPIAHVACQEEPGVVQVWTIEHDDDTKVRAVRVYGTGQPVPDDLTHLGSLLTASGRLVWHVFGSPNAH